MADALYAANHASHQAAVALLTKALEVDPGQPELRKLLDTRQAALDAERKEQQRLEQERLARLAAEEEKRRQEEARQREEEARRREEQAAEELRRREEEAAEELRRREEEARRQAEEARRREEERRAASAAAVARAADIASDEDAIAVLRQALEADPQDADMRRALGARQEALARIQAEARREAERRERVASAIAHARQTASHEDAVASLEAVAPLDPANAEIASLLDTRRAALAAEREAARQARERAARVVELVDGAKATRSHEAAIAQLTEALTLDPAHRAARSALETRQEALAREQAALARASGIDAARATIGELVAKPDLDGAMQALDHAEQTWQAKKELKDLRKQIGRARTAAARAAGGDGAGRGLRSPVALAGLAAGAAIVLVGGYLLIRSPEPAAPTTIHRRPGDQPHGPAGGRHHRSAGEDAAATRRRGPADGHRAAGGATGHRDPAAGSRDARLGADRRGGPRPGTAADHPRRMAAGDGDHRRGPEGRSAEP